MPTPSIAKPSKIYPNWFESVPSGNPAAEARETGGGHFCIINGCLGLESALLTNGSQTVLSTFVTPRQGCQMVYVFSDQKSQFGKILEGLAFEDVDCMYGNLVYFMTICELYFWLFGIFYGYLVGIFSPVLVCCTKKNLADNVMIIFLPK
jgi:hypothetical protein